MCGWKLCCWLERLGFALWVWGELENRSHCSLSVGFVDHAHPLLFVLFKAVRRGRQRVSQYCKRREDLNTKKKKFITIGEVWGEKSWAATFKVPEKLGDGWTGGLAGKL